jgi:hypothetical protein
MLGVIYKPFMLNVIMLNVIMLSVVAPIQGMHRPILKFKTGPGFCPVR